MIRRGVAMPSIGTSCGLDRKLRGDLAVETQGPACRVRPHPGQEPVVKAAAASQAITPGVKRESRDQRPVHFRDFDLGRKGRVVQEFPGYLAPGSR